MHNVSWTYNDPSYTVCGRLFPILFHNVPLRPGIFLSSLLEFLERSVKILCEPLPFLTTGISRKERQNFVWAYFSLDCYTAPGLFSTYKAQISHSGLHTRSKMTAFQRGDVWDLYVSLNSNFDTYVDTKSNDSGTKFRRSWGHMCNYCWKMLLNKKQSDFVQQHLHVKRCWTKSPQQTINRTVSTHDVRVFADLFWSLQFVPLDFERWEIGWKTTPWIAWFCPYSPY